MINIDISKSLKFIEKSEFDKNYYLLEEISEELKNSNINFNELLKNYEEKLFKLQEVIKQIKEKSNVLIVIGIGGSFLGAKACIEILKPSSDIYFCGTSFSSIELNKILEIIDHKDVCISVISKSGSTLEILITLKLIEKKMKEKYGNAFNERIYIITENKNNPLKTIALENKYEFIELERNLIGRFSVFSLASLMPMAFANINLINFLKGGERASIELKDHSEKNPCYIYAILRNILYEKGKIMEILTMYEPSFFYFGEWWKQLFGETEGKENKGIFPSTLIFSRDLHSLGQYIQDGNKFFFETTINIENIEEEIFLPEKLPYFMKSIEGIKMETINKIAFTSTTEAHFEGNIPNIVINIEKIDEYTLGYLVYFFQKACYLSAKILGVDPFSNEGVDLYKNKMKSELKIK